jgi:hypothetical protein
MPAEVSQAHLLLVLIREAEVRRGRADVQSHLVRLRQRVASIETI